MFGCVLDWDFDKKLVVVSLIPELVAERKAVEAHKGKQKKVKLLKIVLTKCENSKAVQVLLMLQEGFSRLANLSGFCLVAAENWENH